MLVGFINPLYTLIQGRRNKGYKYLGISVPDWSKAEVEKLGLIASKYGFPPQWLANLINHESGGTFSPSVKNPTTGATGLIQFMPSFFDTKKLARMSVSQQLDEVDKYLYNFFYKRKTALKVFDRNKKKVKPNFTQTDLYMIIFYPVSVGNPDYLFPLKVVVANNGILSPKGYTQKALRNAPFKDFPSSIVEPIKEPNKEDVKIEDKAMPLVYRVLIFAGISYLAYKMYQKMKVQLNQSYFDASKIKNFKL